MAFRLFEVKIVPTARPDDEGYWVSRVVPDVWPGDDRTGPHMLKAPPEAGDEILPGWHAVRVNETVPALPDQPGTMHDTPLWPSFDADSPQPIGCGLRM